MRPENERTGQPAKAAARSTQQHTNFIVPASYAVNDAISRACPTCCEGPSDPCINPLTGQPRRMPCVRRLTGDQPWTVTVVRVPVRAWSGLRRNDFGALAAELDRLGATDG